MSKSDINTRSKIMDKALEMFNERGIEYVGLRELAKVLDIRVSNITYYFPTKDDLVYELSKELSKANSELFIEDDQLTMQSFLKMLHHVFQNHIKFRSLLLSVVHVLRQNKHLAETYKKTQKKRNNTLTDNLQALVAGEYLKVSDNSDIEFLVANISIISRFWISEAAISSRELSNNEQKIRYLKIISKLLQPYATAKGKRQIQDFLNEI